MNNGDPGEPGSLTEERAERLTRPRPGHPAAVPVRGPSGSAGQAAGLAAFSFLRPAACVLLADITEEL